MISGLTDRASGVGRAEQHAGAGHDHARAEELAHRQGAGGRARLAVDRDQAGEAAGIGRRRATRRLAVPAGQRRGASRRRRRDIDRCGGRSTRWSAARTSARHCATLRAAGCRPSATPGPDSVRASAPWKNSPPPRWRIAPSVPARSVCVQRVAFRSRRAARTPGRRCAASRGRRPAAPAPACRSRDSARDTGTPKRASRSAGRDHLLPAQLAVADVHQRDRRARPTARVNDWPLIAPGAAIGRNTKASAALVLSSCTMQAPEAPRPAADGRVTASGKVHGDCGVGGVAAALQDVAPDLGRAAFVGRHRGERHRR